MNNKKNIDGWMDYVCANWLNRKSQSHFRPSTERLIQKMKKLSADPKHFGDAWHYVEEIEKLQSRFLDDTRSYPKESSQMLLECGIASYKMGNSREAVRFINGAIGFYTEEHDKAVARWLLGCVYWHLENEVEALSAWENGMQGFSEQARKIDKNSADTKWYEEIKLEMENAIKYAVDHNAPPLPSKMKPKSNGKNHLLQTLPLIGEIPAGAPLDILPAELDFMEIDQVILEDEKYRIVSLLRGQQVVNLPSENCFFVLHVRGNSMNQATPEPIDNGDYVILRQQSIAESGDIVAVEIIGVDNRATLKRYKVESDNIILLPESADPEFKKPFYLDHIFTKLDIGYYIRGVAVAVLKPI